MLVICEPSSYFNQDNTIAGRIIKILADASEAKVLVVLDVYQVAATRHPTFGIPSLVQRHSEIEYQVVDAKVTGFSYSPKCYRADLIVLY